MLFKLLFLFTVVPAVELYLLIKLHSLIGFGNTICLILFTGILGSALAKMQGFAKLREIQAKTARGELPGTELVEGILILFSAALLITPGVLTDITGFLLLTPIFRKPIAKRVIANFSKKPNFQVHYHSNVNMGAGFKPNFSQKNNIDHDDSVIEVENLNPKKK
ncbi:MAG: FxsA family protein [Lentisphaeria bacterium]|nr:FxsA family protein [Lentisphaeria bacterium]